jgi:hypothetical protein
VEEKTRSEEVIAYALMQWQEMNYPFHSANQCQPFSWRCFTGWEGWMDKRP